MGIFERYLSLWVGLAIAAGIGLGLVFPPVFAAVAALEYAHVNFVVAVLIWLMIYPMMVSIDFSQITALRYDRNSLLLPMVMNWLIKPFSMALLGVAFFNYVFAAFITPDEARQYLAGLILLGAAPCTAMVFVWSRMVRGDATYTLIQVSLNDLIMVVAYAPIVALLLGVSSVKVPWDTLLLSVLLYMVIPMTAGFVTRKALSDVGTEALLKSLKPLSVIGLLLTVVLLFGFQATTLLAKPLVIAMIAVPILLQSVLIFIITFWTLRRCSICFDQSAPAALVSASNFFELAVAVAISLFGLNSGAALATVVGVLVEVPVMLWLVRLANKWRYEQTSKVSKG